MDISAIHSGSHLIYIITHPTVSKLCVASNGLKILQGLQIERRIQTGILMLLQRLVKLLCDRSNCLSVLKMRAV